MKVVILAKDEALVAQLERCFAQVPNLRACEIFEDLYQGLIYIINELPEIVFVDIDQYDQSALDLSANIKKNYPAVSVAFIAQNEQYAAVGLELGIVKYITKPLDQQLIVNLLSNLWKKKRPEKRVKIKTLGYFDVYIDNELIYFRNSKAKELLALLVDRRGTVSMGTAVAILWENHCYDQNVKQLYRKAVAYLRHLFDQYHVDIFVSNRGSCYVRINDFTCDYYQLLQGDEEVIAKFNGEYMFEYPWAEGTLVQIQKQLDQYELCQLQAPEISKHSPKTS